MQITRVKIEKVYKIDQELYKKYQDFETKLKLGVI